MAKVPSMSLTGRYQTRNFSTRLYASAMGNPSDDVSMNFGDINNHKNMNKQLGSEKNPDFVGIPQKDPEDPTVEGDTCFNKQNNYMDEQFFDD